MVSPSVIHGCVYTMKDLLILVIIAVVVLAKPPINGTDANNQDDTPTTTTPIIQLNANPGGEEAISYEDFNFDPTFSHLSPEYDSAFYENFNPYYTPPHGFKNKKPFKRPGTNSRVPIKKVQKQDEGPPQSPTKTVTRHVHTHKAAGEKEEATDNFGDDFTDGSDWMESHSLHFHKHIHKEINKTFNWNQWQQWTPIPWTPIPWPTLPTRKPADPPTKEPDTPTEKPDTPTKTTSKGSSLNWPPWPTWPPNKDKNPMEAIGIE